MANTKLNIVKHPKQLLLLVSVVVAAAIFMHAPKSQAAACTAPSTNMGSVTSTINVTTAGTYRAFSRIMSGTASTDNSYMLEIDGNSCYVIGDNNSMPTGSWQWIDYQNGSTSSKVDINLSVGTHTIKMIGREDGVKLDRVILTTDSSCPITGTGDNCVTVPDTTDPVTVISSPAANARLMGTVNVTASASDDSGTVTKVEFYVDGIMVGSADTAAPYSFSWNTTTASNGSHSLTVIAYDPSSNQKISSAVSVTVDNSAPTVSMTAPANNSTVAGTVSLAANASDNIGVTSVSFYRGSTLISSDSSSPYSYNWNTAGVADGSYALTARASDAAGNITNSSVVNVTVDNIVTPPPDTTDPVTSISSPSSGATLSGATNNIVASASDSVGVTRVELYIDGVLVGTDVAAPFNFNWNTTSFSNGSHNLYAKAYDAAENEGTSATITLTVSNTTPTPRAGDVNNDGVIGLKDASILLFNWGKSGTRSQGDLNDDTVVNLKDASILLFNWGK